MKKMITTISLFGMLGAAQISAATRYDDANWFATVDVDQAIEKIVPLLPSNKRSNVQSVIKKHMPQQLERITFYGHSEQEDDLGLIASGDFADFDLGDYASSLMQWAEPEEGITFKLVDSQNYANYELQHYSFSDGEHSKSIYSAKINNDLMVINVSQGEVKNWIDNQYSEYAISQSGLVSVLINIESAMAHMGADLSEHDGRFKSAVISKVKQFSASVYEVGDGLSIEGALETADAATTNQLEQVVNGLIAMNALSNIGQNNPVLAALLDSLSIINQGNELVLTTELPYGLIKHFNID